MSRLKHRYLIVLNAGYIIGFAALAIMERNQYSWMRDVLPATETLPVDANEGIKVAAASIITLCLLGIQVAVFKAAQSPLLRCLSVGLFLAAALVMWRFLTA